MIGIYKWTNIINNKSYIGKSVNIESRTSAHLIRSQDKNSNEYNSIFHQALRKYGIENFTFTILKTCDQESLNYWEEYYIKELKTQVPNGYNVASGGQGGFGPHMKFSKEDIIKIIEDLRNTNLFSTDIAKKRGCSASLIKKINYGHEYRIDNEIYPIRSEEQSAILKSLTGSYTSENNPGALLTVEQVRNIIWDLCYTSIPITSLAKKYNISKDQISRINNNKAWKDISRPIPCRDRKKANENKALVVANLLWTTNMSVNDIAQTAGYKDRHTISRINQHLIYQDLLKDYPNPIRK